MGRRRGSAALAALLIIVVSAAVDPARASGTGTLSGTVTGRYGLPLQNLLITVRIGGGQVVTTHTDGSGSYSLQLPAGTWQPQYLGASEPADAQAPYGYVDLATTATILDGQTTVLDETLLSAARITGLVKGSAGRALARLPVVLYAGGYPNFTAVASTTTGPAGTFKLGHIAPGPTYSLGIGGNQLYREDAWPISGFHTFPLAQAEAFRADDTLYPDKTITGSVVDERTGNPMVAATVRRGANQTTAGTDGAFSVLASSPKLGSLCASAGPTGVAPGGYYGCIITDAPGRSELLPLSHGGGVTGAVRTTDGAQAPAGTIVQLKNGSAGPGATAAVATDGSFALYGLPAQTFHQVCIRPPTPSGTDPGYLPLCVTQTVTVTVDDVVSIPTVHVHPGAGVTGKLTQGGQPLANVTVSVYATPDVNAAVGTARTNTAGVYRIPQLSPSQVYVCFFGPESICYPNVPLEQPIAGRPVPLTPGAYTTGISHRYP